ncbi:MAG: aminoglycoside phosphotransferase family protein [Clostridia bacterium]|nr:aminoglycoside phosphotransferase family protein [Clostridia bacterium]
MELNNIIGKFCLDSRISPYGNGHINDTYIVEPKRYILQRINTSIFKNADELMNNIEKVTEFLRKKIAEDGGDPSRETLTVIKTTDGKNLYKYDDNNCFRMYEFVEDTITIEVPENPEQLYKEAKGFASFQKQLSSFPAETLYETIENFHNTPVRFENLKKAIAENKAGRLDSVKAEVEFALAQENWISSVTDGLKDGSIPLRVTHNDTKINNILFDAKTLDALCVIDLDTVMPGSMLYDFGDSLRIGAATAAEDETDLDKVSFNIEAFEAFTKGYAEEMKGSLTEREIELLPLSAKLLTYECGIRFLTDYLEGDTYFKIHRENHNLDRARTQFKLVKSIDKQFDKMTEIVNKFFK